MDLELDLDALLAAGRENVLGEAVGVGGVARGQLEDDVGALRLELGHAFAVRQEPAEGRVAANCEDPEQENEERHLGPS